MFMCTNALHTVFLCMFSNSDLSIYMYLLDFGFTIVPLIFFMLLVIACACMPEPHHLIMHTCDCLICKPLGFIICARGLHQTTFDSHVQILETRPWWPCCSWSEYAADHSVTIRAHQKLGLSPQLFHPVSLLFGYRDLSCCSWAPLSFVYLFMYCTFVFFCWCNIAVILCHSLW